MIPALQVTSACSSHSKPFYSTRHSSVAVAKARMYSQSRVLPCYRVALRYWRFLAIHILESCNAWLGQEPREASGRSANALPTTCPPSQYVLPIHGSTCKPANQQGEKGKASMSDARYPERPFWCTCLNFLANPSSIRNDVVKIEK